MFMNANSQNTNLRIKGGNYNETTWVFPWKNFEYSLESYTLHYTLLVIISLSSVLLTKSIFNEDFKLLSHVGSSLLSWILYSVYNLLLDGVDYKQ